MSPMGLVSRLIVTAVNLHSRRPYLISSNVRNLGRKTLRFVQTHCERYIFDKLAWRIIANETRNRKRLKRPKRNMIRHVCISLLSVVTLFSDLTFAQDDPKASVVKISVTVRSPDFSHPWNKANPTEASGTGFLIDGNRIVTNAHVVRYASQVYVQPDQSDEKSAATVEAISYGLDLAILKLESPDALGDLKPLAIETEITPLRSEVNVYGFPIGGDQISITKGIVSRIEYTNIGSNQLGLRAQIDAAINPGNSGGPAITDNKVVGVAFSGVKNANNIGYLIHSTELIGFLKDIEDGKCDGKANLWGSFQTTENSALRAKLKLPKSVGGVMVNELREPVGNPLQVHDVITSIGPHAIDSQGNVKVKELTLGFNYYCPILEKDGRLPLTIWRDGQEINIEAPVPKESRNLLPFLHGTYPRYFIYGPLAFEAASGELAVSLLADPRAAMIFGSRNSPLVSGLLNRPSETVQELVVIPSAPFSHRSTKGYRPSMLSVVDKINGTKISSLKHLVEVFRDCSDEFIEIEFAETGAEKLVFVRKEISAATDSILADNNIRKQFSEDLEESWNNGKSK